MRRSHRFEPRLTHSVIGAFYEVYNTLGYGFLEHIYCMAMERELLSRGHQVGRELGVRISYKGHELGIQRLDMVVDQKLVVEIKSTHSLHRSAARQVYNYLKASNLEIDILLHFRPEPGFFVQTYRHDARKASQPT